MTTRARGGLDDYRRRRSQRQGPAATIVESGLVADARDEYRTHLEDHHRSPRTIDNYMTRIDALITSTEARLGRPMRLSDFTLDNVLIYKRQLQARDTMWQDHPCHRPLQKKLSPYSVRNYLAPVRAFSTWLTKHDPPLIAKNVLADLPLPPLPNLEPKSVAERDFAAVLRTCNLRTEAGARDAAILHLAFDTGLRAGEIGNARVRDLDLKGRSLVVWWETSKGGKQRTVYFGARSAALLRRYVDQHRPDVDSEQLFLSLPTKHDLDGVSALTVNAIEQMFRRRCRQAKVDYFHPHQARHTFGPNFLLGGGDPFSLQQLLGHTTLHTTGIYVNMRAEQLREQHRKADPMRWGRRGYGSRG